MPRPELSDPEYVRERLQPWVRRHRRPAWRPVLRRGDGPVTASKYSGEVWLPPDEEWPTCRVCERPLQPFFQLNLDQLPRELHGTRGGGSSRAVSTSPSRRATRTKGGEFRSGLLQLFYCRFSGGNECYCDSGWEPFVGGCQHIRVVHPPARARPRERPRGLHAFPAKTVVGWEKIDDYPKWGEFDELGLDSEYDFVAGTMQVRCTRPRLVSGPLPIDANLIDNLCECDGGDKLGGWPNWIHDADYPSCPRCRKPMGFVYQFTGDPLPFMFGDVGIGYITQCRRHKDVVAFSWQCH